LCAARCAHFVPHKWPTHALRLTQALYEKGAEVVESIDIPRNDTTY